MFNPVETLTGLLNMLIGIVTTGLAAYFLPVLQLVVYPTLSVLDYFASL